MRKYFAIFKYSVKMKVNFIIDYFISLVSFAIHVFVFSQLWDYLLRNKVDIAGYTKPQLIWYIVIGEFILISSHRAYKEIAEQVKSGQIANMLIRPVDYVRYVFADNLAIIIKVIINASFAVVSGLFFAGPLDISALGIILMIISVIISLLMEIFIQLIIGLLAFYTEENDSFWLVFQKLMLLLVFTPLEFYPVIIQKIFMLIPTSYITYAPARLLVKFETVESVKLLIYQIIAFLVLVGFTRILYKKGVEKINVNGG